MITFILKRLGLALITLWILSVIVFLLGQVLPGDPGRAILGPLAAPSAVDHAGPSAGRRQAACSPSTGTGSAISRERRTTTRRRSGRC